MNRLLVILACAVLLAATCWAWSWYEAARHEELKRQLVADRIADEIIGELARHGYVHIDDLMLRTNGAADVWHKTRRKP